MSQNATAEMLGRKGLKPPDGKRSTIPAAVVATLVLVACSLGSSPTTSGPLTAPMTVPALEQSSTDAPCKSRGLGLAGEAVLGGSPSVLQVVPTIEFSSTEACHRLVVQFGIPAGDPVPEIRVMLHDDGEIRAQFPSIATTAQSLEVGAAVDSASDGIWAFVVQEAGSASVRIFPDRELSVIPWWSTLEHVLVLDLQISDSSAELPLPIVGLDGVNVALQPFAQAGEGLELPIEVSGFSRLIFEGEGVVRIRKDAEEQGAGEPVPVELSGPGIVRIPGTTLEHGLSLSSSAGAWNEFEFAIESLDPGAYELFVGDDVALGASDVSEEVGVYGTFGVSG